MSSYIATKMASSDAKHGFCKTLTISDVQEIVFSNNEHEAKEILAEKLGIPPFKDGKDAQKPLFVSFIYDNIMFATEKGFPWSQIPQVVKFVHELLKRMLVEKHKLSDAVVDIKELFPLLDLLDSHQKKQYTDFLYQTVLLHYNLYKYVFSNLRELISPLIRKEVIVPPKPLPLFKGKVKAVYEYEEKLKELEDQEAQAITELREKMANLSSETFGHKTLGDLEHEPTPYSRKMLEELVQDIVSGIAAKKTTEILTKAEVVVQDLHFKLVKTLIPRPSELGIPRQFSLRPSRTPSAQKLKEHPLSSKSTKQGSNTSTISRR
ncbi:unnamed protein product [Lymnaea stagnalis]|uniref:Uncharacterized protein n=1 Tax=Lymnaea stagnalis TaxID=6523 RepID=A0AAV2HG97_LYMST